MQLLNGTVPSLQMNIAQFTFLIVAMTPYIVMTKQFLPTSSTGFAIAFLIGVLKCLNYFCCNLAVLYMPVGTASTEMSIVFLVTILLWTVCCTRDYTTRSILCDVIAVLLITAGVVLVTQPPPLFSNSEQLLPENNATLTVVCKTSSTPGESTCSMFSVVMLQQITHEFNTTAAEEIIEHYPTSADINVDNRTAVNDDVTDRPAWKGHLLIIAFGVSSTACLVLLSKGAEYGGNVEIIYWSAITADALSIMSLALFNKCDVTVPSSSLCFVIWLLHAVCGGVSGFFGNTAVMMLPNTDFGVISSLSTVNLFVLQFTLLEHIKPAIFNVGSVAGAIIICVTTFAKPAFRRWAHIKQYADVKDTEREALLARESEETRRQIHPLCAGCF